DVAADAVVRALSIPKIAELTTTYFIRLRLSNADAEISRNFYWLSTQPDVIDWKNTKWYYTPTTRHADLTALGTLPQTTVTASAQFNPQVADGGARVTVV